MFDFIPEMRLKEVMVPLKTVADLNSVERSAKVGEERLLPFWSLRVGP